VGVKFFGTQWFGLVAVVMLLVTSISAPAQSLLVGSVIDDGSGEPVPGAQVYLLTASRAVSRSAVTDSLGVFSFPNIRAGAYRLSARRLGYTPTTSPALRLTRDDTTVVALRIASDAVLLAPLEVTSRSRRRTSSHIEDFYARQERGFGSFITREQIDRRRPFYITDMLTTVPGVRLGNASGRGGRSVMMARTSVLGECPVQLYVDGILINRPIAARTTRDSLRNSGQIASELEFTMDDIVIPSSVEGIEVYRGLSEVPAMFAGPYARCGVVAVWTRAGSSARR
jgi:hypothetical protein